LKRGPNYRCQKTIWSATDRSGTVWRAPRGAPKTAVSARSNFLRRCAVSSLIGRIGLILAVIGLTASGCFGGGSAGPTSTPTHPTRTPRDRLAVSVRLGLNTHLPVAHHYHLTCDPPGGTLPHPGAACRAISDYLHHNGRGGNCKLLTSATATATTSIVGTFAHKPFKLRITTGSWCGATRPIMRDYWTLSTFPCSTIVIHTGNTPSYADWPSASGCSAAFVVVPKVTPNYPQDAERDIRAAGLRVEIASVPRLTDVDAGVNGYAVSAQSPTAGTHVPTGTIVVLRLNYSANGGPGGVGKPGTVPNLIGMPINKAIVAATSAGLHVTVPAVRHHVPSDSVTAQNLQAGSPVKPEAVITLTLG
jgi:PASTA domain